MLEHLPFNNPIFCGCNGQRSDDENRNDKYLTLPPPENSTSFTGAHTNKNMKQKLERPTPDTEKNLTITAPGKKTRVTKKSKSNGDPLGDKMRDWPEYFHSVSSRNTNAFLPDFSNHDSCTT
jgi:hypothetical protein